MDVGASYFVDHRRPQQVLQLQVVVVEFNHNIFDILHYLIALFLY